MVRIGLATEFKNCRSLLGFAEDERSNLAAQAQKTTISVLEGTIFYSAVFMKKIVFEQ
jgi:hypothetical protein